MGAFFVYADKAAGTAPIASERNKTAETAPIASENDRAKGAAVAHSQGSPIAPSAYVGKCFWTAKQGRVSSLFSYDDSYIGGAGNWSIDPAFPLISGAQPAATELPGAFRDTAPDRWGRSLIDRRRRQEARAQGKTPRALTEVDYLLQISDISRQGCLRFSLTQGGAFEHPSEDIPRIVALPKLLHAADRFAADPDEASVSYLLEAGSASLGGARPKASVADGNRMYIAKFPHRQDEWDVIAWEWVMLEAAAEAGISVPVHDLLSVGNQHVLLTERFDRKGGARLGYISAMTLLGLEDGAHSDYADIALALRDISVSAKADLEELFRRVVFSILVNNTDDHLRNHGLIRNGSGWRLSPVFDVNPNPEAGIRATGVFGETEKTAALAALLSGAGTFGLSHARAEKIAHEVRDGIRSCGLYAVKAGVSKEEQSRFLSIFDPVSIFDPA